MNLIRIWTIAVNGFRETIRDHILYVILFFGLLLAIALQILPKIAAGMDEKIFLDFGLATISLLTALLAIFAGTNLINKEIEKRTVLIMIPKPLTRTEFIIGKHLGLWGVLTITAIVMSLINFGFLAWAKMVYPLGSILIALLYLWLELGVLIAAALLFGSFTGALLAMFLSLGVYLMGHFSTDLVELGKLSDNGTVQAFTQAVFLVLPDFSRLTLHNEAVYGLLPPIGSLLFNALYGIVYMIFFLAIAVIIFARRQF